MRVAVTGANGFVGRAVCKALTASKHTVRPLIRHPDEVAWPEAMSVGAIDARTDWKEALSGIDCVVHCAARVHVMEETEADPLAAFRAVNVLGTRHLAQEAARSGVKRFIFLSTLKVHGESTRPGHPFRVSDPACPSDPYGLSKWEGEQAVMAVAQHSHMACVVIRPPLVYGPGVKANFARLLKVVSQGIPLPLGGIDNRRSMVNLGNLTDLIAVCTQHPAAAGQTFLVSDGQDVSTPELLRCMGRALGKPARLVAVPPAWLQLIGRLSGRQAQIDRLTGSLQVDIGHTTEVLGWKPRTNLYQAMQELVQAEKT
ncbi:MAG: SDR family oxidoreductase [Burkholderiaceae bacterium]